MATQVFPLSLAATTHRGTNTAKLDGSASGWRPLGTSTARGSGQVTTDSTATVAGATNGIELGVSGFPVEWLTPPVDQDITISGTITLNIWASESSMNANVAINAYIEKVSAVDGSLTRIATSTRTTEVAVTTRAVNNFTVTPTSTALNKGDRLRIVIFGDDAGTMGSGFTFIISYNGTSAAADGDTYISFTETFDFQTTDPTGTTVYPTTSTSNVPSTADDDREMWTSRGGTSTQAFRNSGLTGWSAPLQIPNTAISWFTRQLQAFTLSGLVKCNVRSYVASATSNISVGVEIARVDADGTNATIWGYANRDAATTSGGAGEVATSETAYTVYVAGDDLAISDGQRLRVRFFADDCGDIPMAGGTFSVQYNGPTGGSGGDTFLTFGQTLTESTPGTAFPFPRPDRSFGNRDFDPWSLTGWQ